MPRKVKAVKARQIADCDKIALLVKPNRKIMMSLAGKKIVLGVSGGIAAYKTPELVRRLRERGADVRVAMTEAAKAFITPSVYRQFQVIPFPTACLIPQPKLRWATLSWENGRFGHPRPATADLIARVAAGMANDLVSTICLATPASVAVLPAMNQQMYRAAATQHNLGFLPHAVCSFGAQTAVARHVAMSVLDVCSIR
ncbi:flavoprotein [Shigella flexneri]